MTEAGHREPILIVDDDPISIEMVSAQLAAAGYEPLIARDGLKALVLASERQPRIIIADWLMPKMNGLQVCKEIRALHTNPMVYFIMLTIQSDKNRLLEAFDAGVDDFLSKPFHQGELLARVRAGIRMVEMYDELNSRTQAMVRSNAELSKLNEKLRQAACIDELTKLYNRREAMVRLRETWAVAERYDSPLSCAMLDIDHFKLVNDTYGHLKGDEILQRVGEVLLKSVRAADQVFRIGGEEFLVLFPQQDAAQGSICAERCRAMVESSVFADDEQLSPVTISAGVAQRTSAMHCHDDLLKAADHALYVAKRSGRNRMAIA
jgi:diguanylate cyclase (GGDEF)-like protein